VDQAGGLDGGQLVTGEKMKVAEPAGPALAAPAWFPWPLLG
jgi:hypothetical protein